ncbi:uncharacterized protein KD926_006834 [Aspergillus affinis]|uniref:uncharacterized protein n=1 Tax=Aspergillus affinis TaxID=1070780 RepID=UPI0022FE2BBF|nr:uncharacterized protein KD926_006834 [Aspergillus affinis]KAI9041438.1 hypothetical protein KD926_006834 [Aspergillus affinis]
MQDQCPKNKPFENIAEAAAIAARQLEPVQHPPWPKRKRGPPHVGPPLSAVAEPVAPLPAAVQLVARHPAPAIFGAGQSNQVGSEDDDYDYTWSDEEPPSKRMYQDAKMTDTVAASPIFGATQPNELDDDFEIDLSEDEAMSHDAGMADVQDWD